MGPSDVIHLILSEIKKRGLKTGDKLIIPVSWGKGTNHSLKAFLRTHWKTTPQIEGSKKLQTLSVTVVPAMLAGTA